MNVIFEEHFFEENISNVMFDELKHLNFFQPVYDICGQKITPRRKIYGMGELDYTFSGVNVPGHEWSPAVLKMKQDIEKITGTSYNFALLNYFANGSAKISMHKEKEEFLEKNCPLATVCFGEPRNLIFKRKDCPDVPIHLRNGSLILMYHPTNRLFAQGILEDPTVKGVTITVNFKKIKPLEVPCKKPKIDWMDKLFQVQVEMPPSYINFSPNYYAVVKQFQEKFYIDLRIYNEIKEKLVPTKKGVMLTAQEWGEFLEKIREFDFVDPNGNAITSNLLLLNLNGQLHLQQINITEEFLVFLKFAFLKLWPWEVDQLLEKLPEITRIVVDSLWHEFFPRSFAKINDETFLTPCEMDTMRSAFRIVLEAHFAPIVRKFYRCPGCLAESNSQLDHRCLDVPFREQYESIMNILLYVDFDKLFIELNDKRIFTNEFISQINILEMDRIMFTTSNEDDIMLEAEEMLFIGVNFTGCLMFMLVILYHFLYPEERTSRHVKKVKVDYPSEEEKFNEKLRQHVMMTASHGNPQSKNKKKKKVYTLH